MDALNLARYGLWKMLSMEDKRAYRKWADEQYDADREQPVKQVWHPVVRQEWGRLIEAQARAELELMQMRADAADAPEEEGP
jgi:hypothetical protein